MKRIHGATFIFIMRGMVFISLFFVPRAIANATPQQPSGKSCGTVTIAAASDLAYAMTEIAANFEKSSGCHVQMSMGSSGNFLTQIENGAPFDLFFSADIAYPKKLESEGLAAPGSTYFYAVGKIVLWTRNDSRADISAGLASLSGAAFHKIAIANPAHAPYGRAAEEALRRAGVWESVKDRLVLGENISQAAEFVQSGNADAGILALSLVLSPAMKGQGRTAEIPENLYAPIEQGAVVLKAVKNPQGAQEFLSYIKLPATTAMLQAYGFVLPSKNTDGAKR
jgi:molybdate transport system substrate-binding protein